MPLRVTASRTSLKFYQSVGSVDRANQQLSILLNSALRRVLGEATLTQVVRDERSQLMARVREQLESEAQSFGISVVDVRIRRADLPEQNSQAVYQRMQTERQREAAEFRAQGSQKAQEIRARPTVTSPCCSPRRPPRPRMSAARAMANATASLRRHTASDADFFAFYRSMQAYEAGLKNNDTRMLLKPDSEFFRYFVDPSGKAPSASAPKPSR